RRVPRLYSARTARRPPWIQTRGRSPVSSVGSSARSGSAGGRGGPWLDLDTPRLPVAPQPACEVPGAVLEEPPAQQHGLLLQLGPAPVDEGQQPLPIALLAVALRVFGQHLP